MRRFLGYLLTVICNVLLLTFPAHASITPASVKTLSSLVLERNQGQAPTEIEYLARGRGYTAYLVPGSMQLVPDISAGGAGSEIGLRFLGSDTKSHGQGRDPLATRINYLRGRDRSGWRTDINTYARVEYQSIYPGVDLRYHASGGNLEFDFVVAPGANPNSIVMECAGARKPMLGVADELEFLDAQGSVLFAQRLASYQIVHGIRRDIPSRFVLHDGRISFDISAYDHQRLLIIDPVIVRSVRWGGSSNDAAWAVTVDKLGNVYVTGDTNSADLPLLHSPWKK
jgi:hypothetical protein